MTALRSAALAVLILLASCAHDTHENFSAVYDWFFAGHGPTAIAVDGQGNRWVVVQNGDAVYLLRDQGSIPFRVTKTMLDNAVIAGDRDGVWVADSAASRLVHVDARGKQRAYRYDGYGPVSAVHVDRGGSVWFTLFEPGVVARLSRDGTVREIPLPAPDGQTASPRDLAECAGGLWITDDSQGLLFEVDAKRMRLVRPVRADQTPGLRYLVADRRGACRFTDPSSNRVGTIAAGGSVSSQAIPKDYRVQSIGIDGRGNVWVEMTGVADHVERMSLLDDHDHLVGKPVELQERGDFGRFTACGPALCVPQTVADNIVQLGDDGASDSLDVHSNGDPGALAVGNDGELWYTESKAGALGRFDGKRVREVHLPDNRSEPMALVADHGIIWFTEYAADRIGRYDPQLDKLDEIPIKTQDRRDGARAGPSGITFGPDGKLWFTETLANTIGSLNVADPSCAKPSAGQKCFEHHKIDAADAAPRNIVVGPDGALWFTESAINRVGRLDRDHPVTHLTLPSPGSVPLGITSGKGYLWVTEYASDRIARISTFGNVTEYSFEANSGPGGIIATDVGVFVALTQSNAIARVSYTGDIDEARLGWENPDRAEAGAGRYKPFELAAIANERRLWVSVPDGYLLKVHY